MPIEVRHDVPAGMTALVAAMAGRATGEEARTQAQLQRSAAMSQTAAGLGAAASRQHMQIQAAAEGQQRQIEAASAQAHANAEEAKDRIGYQAGLQEEMQEQKFQQAMEGMKQKAQSDAEQWEWKLDTTAKKKQAEYNRVSSLLNDPDAMEGFSEVEIAELKKRVSAGQMGLELSQYRVEPQWDTGLPNQFKGGMPGTTEDGMYGHFTPNRTTGVAEFKQLDPTKSLEYHTAKAQAEQEEKRIEAIQDIEEKRTALAAKLFGQPVPVLTEAGTTWYGSETAGGEKTGETRPRTFKEAMTEAEKFYPREEMQQQQPQAGPEAEQLGGALQADDIAFEQTLENPRDLIGWWRTTTDNLTDAEKKLPKFEGMARSFMREVRRRQKSGRPIPPSMTPAIKQALAIMERAKANAKD